MIEREALVQTTGLAKVYAGDVRAVDGVDLTIRRGELLAVMGPSGSGKSTLLNLLAALDRPTAGEIWVAGEPLSKARDLDRFRSRTVGLVFQMHNLIPTLTARENVEVPMREMPLRARARRERANRLLALVGLSNRIHNLPAQLSGGERQRVAIARALANEPPLVLADEPTGNLDTASGAEVLSVFRSLNREHGVTVLIVTHDPTVARGTDRVVTLQDGRIVRDEPIGDPHLADLRGFKRSGLGQELLQGRLPETFRTLGLESEALALQKILATV
jgi:ABC-type lipoprotein export system ATPase subunit